jgi:hypothetical protein
LGYVEILGVIRVITSYPGYLGYSGLYDFGVKVHFISEPVINQFASEIIQAQPWIAVFECWPEAAHLRIEACAIAALCF